MPIYKTYVWRVAILVEGIGGPLIPEQTPQVVTPLFVS